MAEEENVTSEANEASDNSMQNAAEETNSTSGLEALSVLKEEKVVEVPREPIIDKHGRSYATGKRKNAIARVWIKPGPGKITVNGRDVETYFARPVLRMMIAQPFDTAERNESYDVTCTVTGGGLSGQAGAVRHGISKALTYYEPDLRPVLKKGGFLTRDPRVVERKKYGKAKARRTYQFSCVLRAVTASDAMTAEVATLPMSFLTKTASQIIESVYGINRVLFDISTKPRATIEW